MKPPWDENCPQWQAFDTQIEEDDLVRVISQSVDDRIFEVEAVFDVYSGRGSAAHPPDLLLKLALYEHCRGRTKPIQWHRDLKSDIKVQWLTFGTIHLAIDAAYDSFYADAYEKGCECSASVS